MVHSRISLSLSSPSSSGALALAHQQQKKMKKATATSGAQRTPPPPPRASPVPSLASNGGNKLDVEKKGNGKTGNMPQRDYGIGTLIVRLVAAKNLPPATPPSFFFSGTANPYCVFDFEVCLSLPLSHHEDLYYYYYSSVS